MTKAPVYCSFCLTPRKWDEEWFLLLENRWTDRLTILSWNDELAANPETHVACSVVHAQLLVIHWMTTGTLNYPFARLEAHAEPSEEPRSVPAFSMKDEPDLSGAKVLAELAVHRDSIDRILVESPTSLAGLIAALKDALPHQADRFAITELEPRGDCVLSEA